MQKVVLKLDVIEDMNSKQKAMKLVSSIPGIESISMDIKEKKLTVIGDMDPIALVKKLRKNYYTDILSVGPAKEPEKPKDESKKKDQPKPVVHVTDFVNAMQAYNSYNNHAYYDPAYSRYNGYYRSVEEDPNACVIC